MPRRTTSPSFTRALLKPLEPQSAQQLQGIHSPSSFASSPVSLSGSFSLKPAQPVVPSAAVPTAARPVHFSKLRRVMGVAGDSWGVFTSSIITFSSRFVLPGSRSQARSLLTASHYRREFPTFDPRFAAVEAPCSF
ncbi:hypothetical protein D5273_07540 [Enterorhabdus caecimuris]|nr:hypothetical protein [Adlercreutzia caecimuris]